MPNNQQAWQKVTSAAGDFLAATKDKLQLTCKGCERKEIKDCCKRCRNRRGNFRAMSEGVSYGGGQKV